MAEVFPRAYRQSRSNRASRALNGGTVLMGFSRFPIAELAVGRDSVIAGSNCKMEHESNRFA